MKLKIQQGRENKFRVFFLSLIVALLTIFLTSKLWMYDDSPLAQTPYHTNINGLDQTTLTLSKWVYNPNKKFMEVTMKTRHIGSDAVKPKLSYTAKERDSTREYPVEVIYQDDWNVVLHIKDVSNDFKVVGLFVRETRDKKILENEIKTLISDEVGSVYQDDQELEIKLPKPKEKIIIGDYRTIKQDDTLKKKAKKVYQAEIIEGEIKKTKDVMDKLIEERIPYQEDLKRAYEKEINELQSDMEFQTAEEQVDTSGKIRIKEGDIERVKEQQEEYQKQVNSLKEKIVKLNERLDRLLGQGKKDVEPKDELPSSDEKVVQEEQENEDVEM